MMESQATVFHLTFFLLQVMVLAHVVQGYSTGRPDTLCSQGTSIYHPHPDDCSKYYQCDRGEVEERNCPCGKAFSDVENKCVDRLSAQDTCTPANAVRECDKGAVDLIPHPGACERYYNCSDTSPRGMYNLFAKYENECVYPALFDTNLKKCVGFEKAECGPGRVAAKWKCDYLANTCPRSHCIPCAVNNPSCLGKEDGVWPHSYKLWSPYFTTCVSERSTNGEERCASEKLIGMTQLFHPEKRQCVPLWDIPKQHGGFQPSCDSKSPGFYEVDEIEIVSFKCPGEEKFLCRPPLRFHHNISQCIPL